MHSRAGNTLTRHGHKCCIQSESLGDGSDRKLEGLYGIRHYKCIVLFEINFMLRRSMLMMR